MTTKKQKLPKYSIATSRPLALALGLLIVHLTHLRDNPCRVQAQQQPESHRAASAVQQPQNKIGLAPHDRPACQLSPLQQQQQRRFLPQTSGLDSLETSELLISTNSSLIGAAPIHHQLKTKQQATTNSNKQQFDSSERLRLLRGLLTQNNYDAYLVTSNDEHGSEYVADIDRRLKFISGFSGSAGYALILLDRAVLFTDGRYALQADQDLDCNWWLVVGDNPLADIHLWLKANAAQGIRLTSSADLMSMQMYDYLEEQIRLLGSKFELSTRPNFIDDIRDKLSTIYELTGASSSTGGVNQQQAANPIEPLLVHPLQFAGNVTWQEKVLKLVDSMTRQDKARHYVITQLDEVAWLLNLRGNDIPQSPLFKAFIVLSVKPLSVNGGAPINQPALAGNLDQLLLGKAGQRTPSNQVEHQQPSQFVRLSLFVDLRKIDQQIWDHLRVNNISIVQHQRWQASSDAASDHHHQQQQPTNIVTTRIQVDLEDYNTFIRELGERLTPGSPKQMQGKLLLNAGANMAIHALANQHDDYLVLVESLVQKLKAVKSDGEVQGMRLAHWRDSLAISMLLAQLDLDIGQEKQTRKWTEVSAAQELEFYRQLMDHNRGQSFDSISAYGANGAIVHYRPNYEQASGESSVSIGNQSTYLLDTGGQYLDGTTDITRTVHFGEPTEFQRETYTRVLMGAIDMMSLIFDQPKRSPYRLNDLLARRHLFELGLDYAHGTGHGIGLYSLVHEAPALIEHYSNFAISQQQQQQRASQQHGGGGGAGSSSSSNSGSGKSGSAVTIESNPIMLQANMFTSVEPGFYKANDFGIRLENIVVTQRVNLKSSLSRPNDRDNSSPAQQQQQRQFLRFEPISLVPFEPKLIKLELLSNKQKTWLNSYNLMVRLRMTQQINHYLAKIRTYSQPTATTGQPPIAVRGVSSSSHLHQQQLLAALSSNINSNNSSNSRQQISASDAQLGHYNYLRLDAGRLQEKLEQTHKWIMAKTELISLDVPQSFIAAGQERRPTAAAAGQQSAMFGRKQSTPNPMSGQRLMLAYMSSMPFNDVEAGQAIAALNQQQRPPQLDARADNATGGSSITADFEQSANNGNKCHGFECDIWLVGALNSQPGSSAFSSSSSSPSSAAASAIKRSDGWPEMGESSASSKLIGNELLDLFSLKDSAAAHSGTSMGASLWSIGILSLIVVLQLGIMALMCSGGASGKLRGRKANTGRRRNWCPNASIERPAGPSSVAASLRSTGSQHEEMRQESMA